MTFCKPTAAKNGRDYDWELNRFCSKINMNVIGGANRLFCAFKRNNSGIIVSFCDLRWGTGGVYEHLNMELMYETKPNYYYIGKSTNFKRKHRFSYTKQNLIKKFNADASNTEKEIAEMNGLYQLYDCGHLKYKMEI